jgi:hypothetical protein
MSHDMTASSSQNSDDDIVSLGFKIPRSFRRKYREAAFNNDITMTAILTESFRAWSVCQKRNEPHATDD